MNSYVQKYWTSLNFGQKTHCSIISLIAKRAKAMVAVAAADAKIPATIIAKSNKQQ
jgi:hypothetical protein